MVNAKRLIVATLSGLLFGFVCFGLASSGGGLPMPIAYQIIAERTLLGFAIGISVLKLGHWTLHGLVMGSLVSIPLAFSGLMAPENPQIHQADNVRHDDTSRHDLRRADRIDYDEVL